MTFAVRPIGTVYAAAYSGVTVPDLITIYGSAGVGGTAVAGIRFYSNGVVYTNVGPSPGAWAVNGFTGNTGRWLTSDLSNGVDYEIRATLQAGSNPGVGTMNTWLDLGTNRDWIYSAVFQGNDQGTILFEIRDAATMTVRDSVTVIFEADAT